MDAYALIIGIDDYTAYDASGQSNLKGAVNDAAGWLSIARLLGIPAANTRVLTSRPIDGTTGGTTRAEIIRELEWLHAQLDVPTEAKGLICFSGHGAWDGELGSLLCPSDVTAVDGAVAGGLAAAHLYEFLDRRPLKDDHVNPITLFIDACDTGAGGAPVGARRRGLGHASGARSGQHTFFGKRAADLLLAASRPGSESYEVETDGGFRGVFSHAATSVLHRWGVVDDRVGKAFNLRYDGLAERIAYICAALDVPQRAHFDSNHAQAGRRVFTLDRDTMRGQAPVPNPLGGREISPAADDYQINMYTVQRTESGTLKSIATLYAPSDVPPQDWGAGTVYWKDKPDYSYGSLANAVANLPSGSEVRISFGTVTQHGSKTHNPVSITPSDCESSFDSATLSTTLVKPTGTLLEFDLRAYLVVNGSTLEWYLPGVIASPDMSTIKLKTSSDSPGTDYLEADDTSST